jgi:hypothetical protein
MRMSPFNNFHAEKNTSYLTFLEKEEGMNLIFLENEEEVKSFRLGKIFNWWHCYH